MWRDWALMTSLVVAPVFAPSTHAGVVVAADTWDGRPASRRPGELRAVMLEVHNAAREAYGVAPLVWSDALAETARRYAVTLAVHKVFAHDRQVRGAPRQGENLLMGTLDAFRYAEMVQCWVDERRDFKAGAFPDIAKSGHWAKVGHYTQIIWPSTREFGCAVASNTDNDFLVCRYLPAGNWVGTILN